MDEIMVIMPQCIGNMNSQLQQILQTRTFHAHPNFFQIMLANLGVLYFSLAMSVSGYKGNYSKRYMSFSKMKPVISH